MGKLLELTETYSCNECSVEKPLTLEYFHSAGRGDNLRKTCKECVNKKRRENIDLKKKANKKRKEKYANDPEYRKRHKDRVYRNKFGITLEEYNKMFNDQNGCCKLCGIHQSNCPKALAVDHCHEHEEKTGEILIRGLLCGNCNKGLGNFKDNTETLKLAISYLLNNGEI